MRPSMWSSYLVELSPEEMVETFVGHGWECSELSDEHGRALLRRGGAEREGKKFRKFAHDRGFSFPQGHFYLTADIAEESRLERIKVLDSLKKWCGLFNALDVKAGVLHPGIIHRCRKENTRVSALSRAKDMLGELLEYSADASFTICLENLIREFNTFEDLWALINSAGGRPGICLDTGHLNMNGGDCAEFVESAGSILKALHVSDSIGAGCDHMLPYGAGDADWKKFMRALKRIGYNGLFNFEVPRENRCPMEIRLKKLDYAKVLAEEMLDM